ncbi:hypothetical protein T08_11283 [Trichinella sp. T8]|nr:hypothetical protein T08_11283 [Trichinella sp. T8]
MSFNKLYLNVENPFGDQSLPAWQGKFCLHTSLCLAFGKQKAVLKSVAAVITNGAAALKRFNLKITF